jgi:hypothetical protein
MWGPILRQLFMTYGIKIMKTGFHAAKDVYDKSGHSGQPIMSRLWRSAETMASVPKMSREEAIKVLEVPKDYTDSDVISRADLLVHINEPSKGGSFFFQCKILGAKQTLLEDDKL